MKSVYIHIPFCNHICAYCDFCKFFYNKKWIKEYFKALLNEVKKRYKGEKIKTLYIGGGTPSILNLEELSELFKIITLFNIEDLEEFTIECNIEDITEEKLKYLKKNKVNRLSIGIQSFNKRILKELGRNYKVNIIEKINLCKKYFNNISIDLIYAYFNQNLKDLENDINTFLSLNINHISCYSLMIEEHTSFYNKKEIDEELDYEMYMLINKKLKENGFIHYEISNYSKKGYESKHNLVYWNNEEYYGFGLSSASYIGDKRTTNTKNFTAYISALNKMEVEVLKKEDKMKYEMILGLRKKEGINKIDFYNKYNIDVYDAFNIKKLIILGYLKDEKNRIFINENYVYLSNEILINFV